MALCRLLSQCLTPIGRTRVKRKADPPDLELRNVHHPTRFLTSISPIPTLASLAQLPLFASITQLRLLTSIPRLTLFYEHHSSPILYEHQLTPALYELHPTPALEGLSKGKQKVKHRHLGHVPLGDAAIP